MAEKKESFDRDNDTISQEEFQKLEKTEEKKNPLKKMFKGKEKKEEGSDKPAITPTQLTQEQLVNEFYSLNSKFDNLLVNVEKQSGRIDMEQDARKSFSERLVNLSSQVGELRSVIVSKERFFDRMESEYQKMKDQFSAIKPEKIEARFDEVEKRFVKNEANVEKISSQLQQVSTELEGLNNKLAKLGTYENLFQMLEKINSQVKSFEELKNHVEKVGAKVESYFNELNDKISTVDNLDSRIKTNENSCRTLSKENEKLKAKIAKAASNDDMNKVQKDVEVLKKDIFKKDISTLKSILQPKGVQSSESKPVKPQTPKSEQAPEAVQQPTATVQQSTQNKPDQQAQTVQTTQKEPDQLTQKQSSKQFNRSPDQSQAGSPAQTSSQKAGNQSRVEQVEQRQTQSKPSQQSAKSQQEISSSDEISPEERDDILPSDFVLSGKSSKNESGNSKPADKYKPLEQFLENAKKKGILNEQLIKQTIQKGWPENKVREIVSQL